MAIKRISLKIAYTGTDFDGFQIQPQPEKRTVEREIFRALQELGIIKDTRKAGYQAAGRTDKGVHAIGQVIAFNTDKPELSLPRIINTRLPDTIRAWARAEVSENFDPRRHAVKREYRYILYDGGFDLKKMKSAARLFTGEHDFANFSTREKGKSTVRFVKELKIKKAGDFLVLDIAGESFTWNMVRKIVTALRRVGRGERDEDWIKSMLNPSKHREGLENSAPYGLILRNVSYKGVRFEEDIYARKKAHEKLIKSLLQYRTMARVFEELTRAME